MNEVSAPPSGPGSPAKRSLTSSTISNFLWMFSGAGTEAVLKILVLAILARLLTPADFGVVSAALSVVALAELFGRSGVAPAIVQAPVITEDDIRTGFTITMLGALLVTGAVFAGSGLISSLFNMPELQQFVAALSVIFLIRGLGLISEALLQRRQSFRILATLHFSSYLVGYAGVAVTLSYLGYGAWALVYGQIAQSAVMCVLLNIFGRHSMRPALVPAAFKHLIRFGFGITLARIGNYVALNADYFIIGRWLGAEALGYYSRAYLLLWQPAQLVGTMGDRVMFPAMASIQDNKERIARALNRTMGLCAFTQLPLSALLIVLAPEIIDLLLGPQWTAAILPFQILLSVLVFRTAHKFVGTTLRATGVVYMQALWQWSYALSVIAAAYLGIAGGIVGVSIGVSAAILVSFWIGLALVGYLNGMSLRPTLMAMLRFGLLSLLLGALLYGLKLALHTLDLSAFVMVLAVSAVAGLIWLGLIYFKPSVFGEDGEWVWTHILSRLKRKAAAQN